jgi:hypothetical protein
MRDDVARVQATGIFGEVTYPVLVEQVEAVITGTGSLSG